MRDLSQSQHVLNLGARIDSVTPPPLYPRRNLWWETEWNRNIRAHTHYRTPVVTTVSELHYKRLYPKVSGLAAWSENCKWYSSLPLMCSCIAILWVSLVSFDAITLCVASQRVFVVVYFVIDSVRKLSDALSYSICFLSVYEINY
jgi:hypothetical protein